MLTLHRLFFIIAVTFLGLTNINSQSWIQSLVINASLIEPNYSAIDNQGNLLVLSNFADTAFFSPIIKSYGSRDLLLTKISPAGNVLWTRRFGSDGSDVSGGLTLDLSNNVYVTGTFVNNTIRFTPTDSLLNKGSGDIFIAKYNTDGVFQWAKRVASASTLESSMDFKFDGTNRFIMCGYFRDSLIIGNSIVDDDTLKGNAYNSHFIAAFDLEANLIWSKYFQTTDNSNTSRIYRIGIGLDGYYFGGFFSRSIEFDIETISSYTTTFYDAFIFKTNLLGEGQWVRRIRGDNHENFRDLSIDEYENIYLLGNYRSGTIYVDSTSTDVKTIVGNTGGYDTYIGKYNRSGILQWFLRKGSSAKDIYNDFVVRNNIIYATGYYGTPIIFNDDTLRTNSSNMSDAFLAAFNEIGDPISGVSINGTDVDKVTPIVNAGTIVNMDGNSRAYVSGYFKARQIQIGDEIYTSSNFNKSDLFFAIYQQQFKAVITDERNVSCFGLSDGMLTATPYFGRAPYTYSWSHNPSLNNPVADNLAAGDYTVTITDANDSTASITGTISQYPLLAINGLVTPVTCFNHGDGAVNITVTGGSPAGYQYYWTTLDGSGVIPLNEDQINLSQGTYTVAVWDANNCADTVDFIVTEPEPISYEGTVIGEINLPATDGFINLLPAGGNYPYTFVWTGPNGFTAFSEDIGSLADGGLYNLQLTDFKNCVSDTSFLVDDGVTLIAQIVAKTDILCFGGNNGTATVSMTNGTPPYSYDWGPLGTIIVPTQVGMIAGDYIVTVTDNNSQVASASVSILGPSAALNPVLDPQELICYNDLSGVMDLTVSGGTLPYSYNWEDVYYGEDLVNVPADVYTVIVTDGNGCTEQRTAEITQPAAITLSIGTPLADIKCHGDRTAIVTATASGGTPPGSFSYQWDDPGAQTTQTAFDLEAGTYTVVVTDGNGCTNNASIIILEPDALTISTVLNAPSCAGLDDGSIIPTVTGGTGGYDYIWSNNFYDRFNTDIPAGTYILTLNDDNNCVLIDTFELADPDIIEITSIDSTDVSCLGKTDGSISLQATGGTGVLLYSSNNGASFGSSPDFANLAAGDYTLIVSDENDCMSEAHPVNLTITDTVIIDNIAATDASCLGLDDGSLEINASGGDGAYEYSVDGGTTYINTPIIVALTAGNYNVLVRDGEDCYAEEEAVTLLYTDTVDLVSVQATDLTCSGLTDGSIAITASGGDGTYMYSTDGGLSFSTTSTIGSLPAGDYHVVVKDGNECLSETGDVTLVINDVCGLIIYDAFSPNGDQYNNVWNIGNAGPNIKVKIFNLWGKLVFSSSGYSDPWDGTFEGKVLPSGTYYYVIDPGDGSNIITGDVSIVK